MSKTAKQIIIILVLLLMTSVGAALLTFHEKGQIEKTSEQTRARLENQIESQFKTYQQQKAELENDLKVLMDQNDVLNQQLDRSVQQKDALENEIETLSMRINNLTSEIEQTKVASQRLSEERDQWRSRHQEIQKERDEAVATLAEQTKAMARQREIPQVSRPTEPVEPSEGHWAGVLKEKAQMALRISDLENELSQSSIEIEEFKKRNRDLELQVSHLNNERIEMERTVQRTQQMIDKISLDLVREKKDNKFIHERFDQMKEENLHLQSQVRELGEVRVALERSVSQLHTEKNEMQRRLKETDLIIQSRIDEVAEIKRDIDRRLLTQTMPQAITLPPIVVGASASDKEPVGFDAPTFAKGSILNVNQQNNFVIIDLGDSDGIKNGDIFSVYRQAQYVGEIQVIQVRQDIAAADIKKQSRMLQIGDVIK